MSRPLKPPTHRVRRIAPPRLECAPSPPAWPSFGGTATYVGSSLSGRCHVFYDATLGSEGLGNASDLVSDADRIIALNDSYFGATQGETFVIVFALGGMTDGTGGADHLGCDYASGNAIEVCASFGQSARVGALYEAELSECNMGNNLCGTSTGEGLSRWCATLTSGNALSDFATAPTWAADGMPDFVNATDPTDQDADSTGCTMAFLSWLMSLGVSFPTIAQSMTAAGDQGTLAGLYQDVTGGDPANAWPTFMTAVLGLPFGVSTDDPFAGVAPPAPGPPPPPPPPPPPDSVTLAQAVAWATSGLSLNWPTPANVVATAAAVERVRARMPLSGQPVFTPDERMPRR